MSAGETAAGSSPRSGDGAGSPDAVVLEAFGGSLQVVFETVNWLHGAEAAALSRAELEEQVAQRGQEYMRRLVQDHVDLRAVREARVKVVDSDGVVYSAMEEGHRRPLTTVFGTVSVERNADRHRGAPNLHPADAVLNLPPRRAALPWPASPGGHRSNPGILR